MGAIAEVVNRLINKEMGWLSVESYWVIMYDERRIENRRELFSFFGGKTASKIVFCILFFLLHGTVDFFLDFGLCMKNIM